MRETRVYPMCCTSAYCGKTNCEGCRNKETLDKFNEWKDRTNAQCADPIWCPTVYVSQESEG